MGKLPDNNFEDARTWAFYPIIMPIDKDGKGPCDNSKIDRIEFEVWDHNFNSYESFEYLPDAINYAIKLCKRYEKNLS